MKASGAVFDRRHVAALGFIVSLALLALAATHLHWQDVRKSLESARLFPWVLVSMGSYLVGHLLRGLRCRLLAGAPSGLTRLGAANVVVIGYAVNNLLPARLGELARSGMLMERTGMPFSQALILTFVERVFDGLVILLLLFLGASFLPDSAWLHGVGRVGAIIFGLAGSGIAVAAIAPQLLTGLASRMSAHLSPRVHSLALRLAMSATRAVACLHSPLAGLAVGALSILIWLCEAGMFLALFPAFALPLRESWALVAMSVTNLGVLIPSSPGFVGPFHFFCMKTLMGVGVSEPLAASYAIIVHLCFFIPVTLWGVLAMMSYGVELGKALSLSRAAARLPSVLDRAQVPTNIVVALGNSKPSSKAERDATEFIRCLSEAILPWEQAKLSPDERERVLASVATFVRGQVDHLPSRLQVLFAIGMLGFRLGVRVRYLRSFCALSLERRRAIVDWWAYGPIGLTRQLLRMPRSTALLAFFEEPIVAAQLESAPARSPRPLPIAKET